MAKKKDAGSDVRAQYVLLAEGHALNDGKHTYFNVFDRLFSAGFPCVRDKMFVGIELQGPAGEERSVTVQLIDSQGSDILPPLRNLKIRFSPFQTAVLQLNLENVRFPKQGFYEVVVKHKTISVGGRMLYVEKKRKG